jgi:hypothetical protein
MTVRGAPDDRAAPRIWADWSQRDSAGRVWSFAGDCDEPERLHPGVLVRAGPRDDVRPAIVLDVLDEPWRAVILLAEVPIEGRARG